MPRRRKVELVNDADGADASELDTAPNPMTDEEIAAELRAAADDEDEDLPVELPSEGEPDEGGEGDEAVAVPPPNQQEGGFFLLSFQAWNARRYEAHLAEAVPLYREAMARAVAIGEQMGDEPDARTLDAFARAVGDVRFSAARVLALGAHLPDYPGYCFRDGQVEALSPAVSP